MSGLLSRTLANSPLLATMHTSRLLHRNPLMLRRAMLTMKNEPTVHTMSQLYTNFNRDTNDSRQVEITKRADMDLPPIKVEDCLTSVQVKKTYDQFDSYLAGPFWPSHVAIPTVLSRVLSDNHLALPRSTYSLPKLLEDETNVAEIAQIIAPIQVEQAHAKYIRQRDLGPSGVKAEGSRYEPSRIVFDIKTFSAPEVVTALKHAGVDEVVKLHYVVFLKPMRLLWSWTYKDFDLRGAFLSLEYAKEHAESLAAQWLAEHPDHMRGDCYKCSNHQEHIYMVDKQSGSNREEFDVLSLSATARRMVDGELEECMKPSNVMD